LSLQAIIFDVDGTLAETEELHRAAFNLAFREAGLAWEWDQELYGELLRVTGGKERIRHYVEISACPDFDALDGQRIARLHARKTAVYTDLMCRGEVQLRPGFRALLEQARTAGVRLAIATTTSAPNVEALLHATLGAHGGDYFEVIAAGDTVTHKKPAPDIYLSALAQLRLSAADCLAVEDSYNGLRAALAAGIATLVVTSAYTRHEQFPGALRVVASLEDLPQADESLLAALRALHGAANAQSLNATRAPPRS
jgi:HAD superfamily hydrolase (TIGR01509 family)